MADFSFGFTEASFLLLNGQKHLRSVAKDLISNNNKKRTKENLLKTAKARTFLSSQANIFQQVITLSDFHLACDNKCHVMKTSSV